MSESKPRQLLKLKLSTNNIPAADSDRPASTTTPKLKLKLGAGRSASKDKTPEGAAASPKLKLTKPKKKKAPPSKKRDRATIEPEADGSSSVVTVKKIKLTTSKKTPTTPYVKFKSKGRPPVRPPGVGYDSEASDREEDPAIEEEFILRMQPGDDCDYLRKAIEEKNWGKQGADVKLKFLQADGRRAVVIIRGRIYAAVLVDMPGIVEGMKSWDRKAWYKSADICQMLLVLGAVEKEADALHVAPPREVDMATWNYAHGLTPPMRWARKRRFRQRVSIHTIEEIEAEVERLFRMDQESAEPVSWKLVKNRQDDEKEGTGTEEEFVELEEVEGEEEYEEDYFGSQGDYIEEDGEPADGAPADDMAAEFEAALGDEVALTNQTTSAADAGGATEATTPAAPIMVGTAAATESEASTPAAGLPSKEETDDDDDESGTDEDVDEDEASKRADAQRMRDECADLESAIKNQEAELDRLAQNAILKRKLLVKIQSLKDDLKLKKAAIGEESDGTED